MPHLTLEYTANLTATKPPELLPQLNHVLADSGLFTEADIKSRAICLDDCCVGTAATPRAFIHARIAMLRGRPVETRQQVTQRLLAALQAEWPAPAGTDIQYCVEIIEIDGESYAKGCA